MRTLEEKIQDLMQKLFLMGRLAESMIQTALRMLVERDESLSREIMEKEKTVNQLQIEVDDEEDLIERVRYNLSKEGFDVLSASGGAWLFCIQDLPKKEPYLSS